MKEKLKNWLPNLILILLVAYVCVLGVATVDELLGWGMITPYFK